jgi:hypothetical protein
MKTRYLEDVQAIRVPPLYHCSYFHDWEWPYLPSSGSQFHRAFKEHYQSDFVHIYQWEAQIDHAGDASDEGVYFTQPWEAFIGEAPGEQVKIRFPSNFHTAKLMVYDREPIDYTTKKRIQQSDSSYLNRTGTTTAYYREDDLDNSFIPYPLPSSITWNDPEETPASADFLYSHGWEFTYLSGTGEQFTVEDEDEEIDYVFSWEVETYTGQDELGHGMWLFETFYTVDGLVVAVSTDTESSGFGQVIARTGSMESSSQGVAVDVVDADDNFVLIYDLIPTDLTTDDDVSDFPIFMRKYVEQLTLSRAYRVNNDGNIKSLAEYWDYRATVGLEAIKKYMSKRKQDRDYQLTIKSVPARISQRHPRLPSSYPA